MEMRILHIVTSIDTGGVSTMLFNYYKYMDRETFHFDIVAIERKHIHKFHELFEELGAQVHYMPKNYIKRLMYVCNLIRNGNYDVIHSHIELPSAVYLSIAKIFGIRIRIAHAHMAFLSYKSLNSQIMRYILNKVATHRWGCSHDALIGLFGYKYGEKSTVIYNAIDIKKYSFDKKKRKLLRKDLLIEDKYVVGFIGRLTYPKNIFYLLDIFYELQRINKDAVLLVAGTGELEKDFLSKIKELDIVDKVIILGVRDDVNNLMMAMDILLLPSRWEGLGIVLIEAQAAALKCFASTKVPQATNLSDYITYMSINLSAKEWADAINRENIEYYRSDMSNVIANKRYDISKEAMFLSNMYINAIHNTKT